MRIEKFDKNKHYDILEDWWTEHNHMQVPSSSLSGVGLVVYDNDTPICMSFLYVMAGCDLAQIAWTTTNPEANLRQKYRSILYCLEGLIALAKKYERKHIISFSSSKGLTKILKKSGLGVGKNHEILYGGL